VGTRTEPIDEVEAQRLANRALLLACIWPLAVVMMKYGVWPMLGGRWTVLLGIAGVVIGAIATIRTAARARRSGYARARAIAAGVIGWLELLSTIVMVLWVMVLIWLFAHSDFTF
jgi:hypothetical protein